MTRSKPSILMVAITAVLLTACGPIATPAVGPGTTTPLATTTTIAPTPSAPLEGLRLTELATGLVWPVAATTAPGDPRLFVVEKAGKIRIVDGSDIELTPFLDISEDVEDDWSEQGLVGLAFHPRYEDNDRVFVYYTREDWSTALVEYKVAEDRNHLDPGSARVVLTLDQPHPAHNGSHLIFGPDGYLYLTMGDGGIEHEANAQDPHDLHGTVLRIDVDSIYPYAIPPDNPFVEGIEGAPEVWVYGLRNPWRITIDTATNQMYLADVGFERWEEINAIDLTDGGGSNFGWAVVEGPICYDAPSCDRTGFVEPIQTVEHVRTCALIGGPVYRGAAIPELHGHYFYADYCVGWVRSFLLDDGDVTDLTSWSDQFGELGQITSFAVDNSGEILLLLQKGEIHRIDPIR